MSKCELYICNTCDTIKNRSKADPYYSLAPNGKDVIYKCPQCWEKINGD